MITKKQLHIHSVPLLLFALIATAAVATVGVAGKVSFASSRAVAFEALVRPMVKVAPDDDGLASIQLNQPSNGAEQLRQALDEAIGKANAQPNLANSVGADMSGLGLGTKLRLLVE